MRLRIDISWGFSWLPGRPGSSLELWRIQLVDTREHAVTSLSQQDRVQLVTTCGTIGGVHRSHFRPLVSPKYCQLALAGVLSYIILVTNYDGPHVGILTLDGSGDPDTLHRAGRRRRGAQHSGGWREPI
ncbi:hypothetical protein B0H17DRAFT_1148019 [Mycena rosella]|uniref:Uncharacterized protein n=1 Tax=Mycena rosella TaxID=1033263 RepID=A0AAD7CGZ0_MYCRO|nr:hypothetical protein B0H17DRAFT_1148019 [Mycena rosella]